MSSASPFRPRDPKYSTAAAVSAIAGGILIFYALEGVIPNDGVRGATALIISLAALLTLSATEPPFGREYPADEKIPAEHRREFDELARDYIAYHFTDRWKPLVIVFGGFTTLIVAAFGVDIYNTKKELDGARDKINAVKDLGGAMRTSYEEAIRIIPLTVGRITSQLDLLSRTRASLDSADSTAAPLAGLQKTSPTPLDGFRLEEKQGDLAWVRDETVEQSTRSVLANPKGKETEPLGAAQDFDRTVAESLTIKANGIVDQYCDSHEEIARLANYPRAATVLADELVRNIRTDSPAATDLSRRLACAGRLLLFGREAFFPDREPSEKPDIRAKAQLSWSRARYYQVIGSYLFAVKALCRARGSDRACSKNQIKEISPPKLANSSKERPSEDVGHLTELITWNLIQSDDAAAFANRNNPYQSEWERDAAVLRARNAYLSGLVKYDAGDKTGARLDFLHAQREATRGRSNGSYPSAMNALAWLYVEPDTTFKDRAFNALYYSNEALHEASRSERDSYQYIDFLETLSLGLWRMGAYYHAVDHEVALQLSLARAGSGAATHVPTADQIRKLTDTSCARLFPNANDLPAHWAELKPVRYYQELLNGLSTGSNHEALVRWKLGRTLWNLWTAVQYCGSVLGPEGVKEGAERSGALRKALLVAASDQFGRLARRPPETSHLLSSFANQFMLGLLSEDDPTVKPDFPQLSGAMLEIHGLQLLGAQSTLPNANSVEAFASTIFNNDAWWNRPTQRSPTGNPSSDCAKASSQEWSSRLELAFDSVVLDHWSDARSADTVADLAQCVAKADGGLSFRSAFFSAHCQELKRIDDEQSGHPALAAKPAMTTRMMDQYLASAGKQSFDASECDWKVADPD